jgi:hypothetical protein
MRDLLGSAARRIPRPAGESAGLRDDALESDARAELGQGTLGSRCAGLGGPPVLPNSSECVIPKLGVLQPSEGSCAGLIGL